MRLACVLMLAVGLGASIRAAHAQGLFEPAPRRHDYAARPLQEAPLAGQRADVLPAAPPLRQALRRAERAGGCHRRAHPSLGGVSLAMSHDIAETTAIPRAPRGREAVP